MRYLQIAFRKLFRKGEHTATRIISLAAGLTFGLILLAEVFYYYSFDSFYPDADRLYVVNENFNPDKQSDKLKEHDRVSGAIGPGLKAEVPGVEAATRMTSIGKHVFYSEDNQSYSGRFVLADEHLHNVLPRPILLGNRAAETLRSPMMCLVSSTIAENMGGNAVGKTIELRDYPGKRLTIGGVFEKFPENSNFSFDIAISMPSIGNFMWDGSQNWLGNDRYYTVVRLAKGTSPQSLAPAVRAMQEKHQNIADLEAKGTLLKYSFEPLLKVMPNTVKNMIFILSAIALVVLFVSVMNYMLLTISTLVNRAKTSAIHKCYGAERSDLVRMIFAESTLIFGLSLVAAFGLILLLKPTVEGQVAHSLTAMFNVRVIAPIVLILGILALLVGYLPGHVFARMPVAAAFRTYRQRSTRWKKALLAVQFAGASLILAMLFVVSMQYEKVKNADHGYATEHVYFGSASGMDPHKIQTVLSQLTALPEVENAGLGFTLPIFQASGNNVVSPEGDRDLFNVNDFYYIDDAYLSILEIPVTEGRTFRAGESSPGDVLISQRAADLLVINNGWTDGVVGRDISISEHNNQGMSHIAGIFPDVVAGSLTDQNTKPSVFFYMPRERFVQLFEQYPGLGFYFLIKTVPGKHPNVIQTFTEIFNSAIPRGEAEIESLAAVVENSYQAQKGFRNGLYTGCLVVLLVTVMGLLGYLSDEIARHRKALAIRKINGATVSDIVHIFVFGVARLAVPCVVVGLAGAWFLAEKWMHNFTQQIALSWWIFAVAGVLILLLTGTVAVLNSLRSAMQNPVKSLRYE